MNRGAGTWVRYLCGVFIHLALAVVFSGVIIAVALGIHNRFTFDELSIFAMGWESVFANLLQAIPDIGEFLGTIFSLVNFNMMEFGGETVSVLSEITTVILLTLLMQLVKVIKGVISKGIDPFYPPSNFFRKYLDVVCSALLVIAMIILCCTLSQLINATLSKVGYYIWAMGLVLALIILAVVSTKLTNAHILFYTVFNLTVSLIVTAVVCLMAVAGKCLLTYGELLSGGEVAAITGVFILCLLGITVFTSAQFADVLSKLARIFSK